jgi:hypothetical protein
MLLKQGSRLNVFIFEQRMENKLIFIKESNAASNNPKLILAVFKK